MNKVIKCIKQNIAASVFNLFLLIILLTPFYYVLIPDYNDESFSELKWESMYIFDDEVSLYILSPIYVISITYQFIKWYIVKIVMLILLACCILLLELPLVIISGSIPVQDYAPSYSQFLIILLFPLSLFMLRKEVMDNFKKKLTNLDKKLT